MFPAPGRTANNGRFQPPPAQWPGQEDSPAVAVWASPPSSLLLPAPSQFPQHPAVASREAEGEDLLVPGKEGGDCSGARKGEGENNLRKGTGRTEMTRSRPDI